MSLFEGINVLAVVVSTMAYFVFGFLWFTVFFGELWRIESGLAAKGPATKPAPAALIGQFVSTLLYSFGVAIALEIYGGDDISAAAGISLVMGVFFIVPVNSAHLFFTGHPKLFLLNVCERIIGTFLVGSILSVWK